MSDEEIAQLYGVDVHQLKDPELRKRAQQAYNAATPEEKARTADIVRMRHSGFNQEDANQISCTNRKECTPGPIGSKCPGCLQYRF